MFVFSFFPTDIFYNNFLYVQFFYVTNLILVAEQPSPGVPHRGPAGLQPPADHPREHNLPPIGPNKSAAF